VNGAGDRALQILVLGIAFVVLGLCTDGCYALAAGTAGRRLARHRAFGPVRRYVTSGVHVALGTLAAVSGPGKD
jgi:threonine/homoserine/homoserine lactone efflux protein